MKIKDLKLILDQYDDEALAHVLLSPKTVYRINRCHILPAPQDPDIFVIRGAEKDEKTSSLILTID